MTVLAPEFLQTTKYSAQRMRAMMAAGGLIQEGIVNFGDFKVSQRGAGANMSVDVAAGDAWVLGDNTARQGLYHVGNDAVVNVAVPAAHATLPRIDQVVLRVYDSTVIGGEKDLAVVEVVSGTATGGATLANLTGAAALPASAIRLAYVLVGAAVVKIETANLGNLRDPRAGLTGYPAVTAVLAIAGAPPQYAMGRPALYVPSVRAVRTAAQTIASSTETEIAFNATDEFDTEGMHDTVTNNARIVAVTPGFYQVNGWMSWVGSAGGTFRGQFLKDQAGINKSRGVQAPVNAFNEASFPLSASVRLGFGDYMVLAVNQDSGGNLNTGPTCALGMTWVGP
jgi:hypothetical protein